MGMLNREWFVGNCCPPVSNAGGLGMDDFHPPHLLRRFAGVSGHRPRHPARPPQAAHARLRIAAVMRGHKLQAHVREAYSAACLDGDGTINCDELCAEFSRNKRQNHTNPVCAETIECLARYYVTTDIEEYNLLMALDRQLAKEMKAVLVRSAANKFAMAASSSNGQSSTAGLQSITGHAQARYDDVMEALCGLLSNAVLEVEEGEEQSVVRQVNRRNTAAEQSHTIAHGATREMHDATRKMHGHAEASAS